MEPSPKLHDFAHDACAAGVCISLLCIVGSAVLRSEVSTIRSASEEGSRPRAWISAESAPIGLPARALRSRAESQRFFEGRGADLERVSVAGAGLFADPAAEIP